MLNKGTTFVLLTAFAGALGWAVAGQAQTQSLGELALKEQERRKALKTPGKVLSNADLPKVSSAPTPKVLPEGTKPEEQKPAKPQEEEKDEAWWRARMNGLREDLRRSELFAEALQTRINSLTSDFSSRDDPYQRARIGEDRQKAVVEMDRVKAEIEAHKKKIADAEDEARRANVPPGWLR